jgi:hypothetical protein
MKDTIIPCSQNGMYIQLKKYGKHYHSNNYKELFKFSTCLIIQDYFFRNYYLNSSCQYCTNVQHRQLLCLHDFGYDIGNAKNHTQHIHYGGKSIIYISWLTNFSFWCTLNNFKGKMMILIKKPNLYNLNKWKKPSQPYTTLESWYWMIASTFSSHLKHACFQVLEFQASKCL